jgi:peptidoglycan hydrolase CwlO-like protein
MIQDTPDNGKVTMALLGQKLDSLIATENSHYNDLKSAIRDQGACINVLQNDRTKASVEISDIRADVDKLEKKSDTWSMLNSLAIGIAGIIGAFTIKR